MCGQEGWSRQYISCIKTSLNYYRFAAFYCTFEQVGLHTYDQTLAVVLFIDKYLLLNNFKWFEEMFIFIKI